MCRPVLATICSRKRVGPSGESKKWHRNQRGNRELTRVNQIKSWFQMILFC